MRPDSMGLGRMRYLLDTNIVIAFQKTGALDDLLKIARSAQLALSEMVFDELTSKRGSTPAVQAHIAEAAAKLPERIEVIRPVADPSSPIVATYLKLRARQTSKVVCSSRNEGEDESLAIALHEEDIVFVCHDGEALLATVNELGSERVLSFHQFLRHLVEKDMLPISTADRIAKTLEAQKRHEEPNRYQAYSVPLWWGDWLAMRLHAAPGAPA